MKNGRKKAGKPYEKIGSGCSEDCMNCKDSKGCTKRFYDESKPSKAAKKTGAGEPEVLDLDREDK